MPTLEYVGTSFGGSFDWPSGAVSIRGVMSPVGLRFEVTDFAYLASQYLTVSDSSLTVTQTEWLPPTDRINVAIGTNQVSLPGNTIDNAFDAWDAGDRSAGLTYTSHGATASHAATALGVRIGAQDYLYVADQNGRGVTRFEVTNGAPTAAQTFGLEGSHYTDDISDMALVDGAAGRFLFVGSASEHGLTAFSVTATGELEKPAGIGMDQRLPITTVTALEAVQVGGRDFVIVAAADSSSLSVLSISSAGELSVTDHIIDSLATRFSGASQLECITVNGHVFVLASGRDDGLSLFRLTAEGRLVHVDTLADGVDTSLQGLSGLGAMASSDGFNILATSANEAGLAHLRVSFANAGIIATAASGALTGTAGDDMLSLGRGNGQIWGGAGDDIISDGSGQDLLYGGSGADTFVLAADGRRDVIMDLNIGQDRLDLSAWRMLRSFDQLGIQSTSWGAFLTYRGEELELHSHNGASLSRADLRAVLPEFLYHVPVTLGSLLVSEDQPAPDLVLPPPPDPTKEPDDPPSPPPPPTPVTDGVVRTGTAGNDFLSGTLGNDSLWGMAGNDTLIGGYGDDEMAGSHGNDIVSGGPGNDNLGGGYGNDTMDGGAGNDALGGGPGVDIVRGGSGHDNMGAGPGNDSIYGEQGNDKIGGSYGHDRVEGNDGDDHLGGGPGNDTIYGGYGNDRIGASFGDDYVNGGSGNDFLAGSAGQDTIVGGPGFDTINAGAGHDLIKGGSGSDTFVFNDLYAGEVDRIIDFENGLDIIRLRGILSGGNGNRGRFDALNVTDIPGGVQLIYGGHQIIIEGVTSNMIGVDDFLFI